jgi:hypothetical protein
MKSASPLRRMGFDDHQAVTPATGASRSPTWVKVVSPSMRARCDGVKRCGDGASDRGGSDELGVPTPGLSPREPVPSGFSKPTSAARAQ